MMRMIRRRGRMALPRRLGLRLTLIRSSGGMITPRTRVQQGGKGRQEPVGSLFGSARDEKTILGTVFGLPSGRDGNELRDLRVIRLRR